MMYTEDCSGESEIIDADGESYTLKIFFERKSWKEAHPYGEGFAYEDLCENGDVSYYELDGEEITHKKLLEKFGKEKLDQAIERAYEDG